MSHFQCFLITGFMGAGKTYLMDYLRESEGLNNYIFNDLDREIEKLTHQSVAEIINNQGLKAFRLKEKQTLESLIQSAEKKEQKLIMSLGGGTLNEETLGLIKNYSVKLIWLKTPFELCHQRVLQSVSERPLSKKSKEQLYELYKKREAYYQAADLTLQNGEEDKLIQFITSSTMD